MDRLDDNPDQPATVLIVDDDPGARLLLGTALEMAGFRVATAADGATAIGAFQAQPSDCIVLDVVMPGMNGFDTCIALRGLPNCRHVPILMQTSLDDMESVNKAYTAGATDFSSKGINPMLLAQRVKFLVRAKRTQDQLRASEARVRYLAYYDPLTGLPNRERLRQILDQQVEWAGRSRRGVSVLMLDVDNFSRINDTHGSAAGDALLKEVALRLQHCLRDGERPAPDAAERERHQGLGCPRRRRQIRPGSSRRLHHGRSRGGGAPAAARPDAPVRHRRSRKYLSRRPSESAFTRSMPRAPTR